MDIKNYIVSQLTESLSEKESHSMTSILFEDIPNIESIPKNEIDSIIHRIVSGEPIQYVTGLAPFYGYFFGVDKNVLIPRPETEELVYTIEKYIKKEGLESCKILDIGTGSGCIPIVLSLLFPKAEIIGLDISEQALELARKNNLKLNANVDLVELDILDESNWDSLGDFDIIISNPPYIPEKEKQLMHTNVLDYEPHLALFVEDSDPYIFYKKILLFADETSKKASVFLECNEFNAEDVAQIYSTSYKTSVIKDLQGKNRIVQALTLNMD
jgi:release factor glutamine methyltransferase